MINQHFVIAAYILPVAGCVDYILNTLRGKTQPNRVSWLLWTIIPFIAFGGELAQHAKLGTALFTLVLGCGPVFVLLSSFANEKAYWKISMFDIYCGFVSVLAVILWLITGKGDVAIVFSMLADLFAAIPTLIKAYHRPKSESASAYVTGAGGAAITLLVIKTWTFGNFGFPLYIFVIATIFSILILYPRPRKAAL